ncbi:MAG: type VI secretion system baseplate subunit TssK [Cyclobacteriaceae bacterium]
MQPYLNYHTVNWRDGMKVNKDHFTQQENALLDTIRDLAAMQITPYNYGLLNGVSNDTSLEFSANLASSRKLTVALTRCRAITLGGARIEINAQAGSDFSAPIKTEYEVQDNDQLLYDVIITVNPFSRQPIGSPDPEEVPLRHPFSSPRYQLQVVPSHQINITDLGAYHLTLAKVRVIGNEVKVSDKFIPPCSRITAHPTVVGFYDRLIGSMIQTGSSARQVIIKMRLKSEQSQLVSNLYTLSEEVLNFVAAHIDSSRLRLSHLPPIHLMELFAKYARTMRVCLDCMTDNGKEEALNYIQEWTEIRPGTIENTINGVLDLDYDHLELYAILEQTEIFSSLMEVLFAKLGEQDFIGKPKKEEPRPKNNIFVRESTAPADTKKKGNFWKI